MILSLLTSRLTGPVATVAAIAFLGLAVNQCSGRLKAEGRANKAEAGRIAALADLKTCKANTVTLNDAVKRQNLAVEAVRREGEAKVAESAKAARSARAVAESLRRDAARVLASKAGADACRSADELVLREVG